MNTYDLIAFDMDGTLLDDRKRILPDSLAAMEEAAARGRLVTLATGRGLPELSTYLPQLSMVRYLILNSGALVLDRQRNEPLAAHPLSNEVLRELQARLAGEDVMIHALSEESVARADQVLRMGDYHMEAYQALFEAVARRTEDVLAWALRTGAPVYKLNLYCRSADQRPMLFLQGGDGGLFVRSVGD